MQRIKNNYRFSVCPFCNSGEIKKIGELAYAGVTEFSTYTIDLELIPETWKCLSCHSSFTQNTIPPQQAESLYGTGEGSKRWAGMSFEEDKTNTVIEALEKVLKKNNKLLDIGCNTGEFLDYSRQKGVQTFGLEICKESCDILRSKGHHAYRVSGEINETFDVVTAFDVVEHLYGPKDFFSFTHKLLNPNGLLVVLTGNPESSPAKLSKNKWWYFNYPEHVVFPSSFFFNNIEGFELKHELKVYASKDHERGNPVSKWKEFIFKIMSGNYNGRPAFTPDHHLIILQKK
jgi:SAM-dependent methyltransferase